MFFNNQDSKNSKSIFSFGFTNNTSSISNNNIFINNNNNNNNNQSSLFDNNNKKNNSLFNNNFLFSDSNNNKSPIFEGGLFGQKKGEAENMQKKDNNIPAKIIKNNILENSENSENSENKNEINEKNINNNINNIISEENKNNNKKDAGPAKKKEIGKVIKISEELNKPDELDINNTDKDYVKIINQKMKKYKKELDDTINKIEKNKELLNKHEENFNNFIETINISNKIINSIKDNINNNTRELENILSTQDKIIQDLDEIDENLSKKIKIKKSKDKILKENDDYCKKIEKTFDGFEGRIKKCYENMKSKNDEIESTEIKTLNQLLGDVHCKIKKDIQGKILDSLNNIFQEENKFIS